MPSSHLILCQPLLLLPPIPPSIRVFSNESTLCMRWPKYWSFSFIISPSNEYLGLIHLKALKPRTILWQGNIMLFVSSRFVRKFHPLFWTTDKTSPHDTKLPGMLSNHAFQNLCSFLLFGYHCNTSYPTEKELLVALEYK